LTNWTFSKLINKLSRKKILDIYSYFGIVSTGTGGDKRGSTTCEVVKAVEVVVLLVGMRSKRNSSASTIYPKKKLNQFVR